MGSVLVKTQFVSVFFEDIDTPGKAVGTLILDFKAAAAGSRERRLLTVEIPSRVLQDDSSTVQVEIDDLKFVSGGMDESSASSNMNILAASVILFFCVCLGN